MLFSGKNFNQLYQTFLFQTYRWPFRSLDENFTKIKKKNILLLPSLIIFIHKTPVIENHQTTGEIRELLQLRSTLDGNHNLFLHEQLAHLHTGNTQKKVSNIASDENIMENNYMIVML